MCGIAGIFNFNSNEKVTQPQIEDMVSALYHRGPDEYGVVIDRRFGMGMSRLSIIDLTGGAQPISNEDASLWLTFNGEIFNYIELTESLKKQGHRFKTSSDSETIIHLYEQYGPDFVHHLNGQFAIAIWDRKKEKLILARDRVGIRPLFFSQYKNHFYYGSEMKAIFRVAPFSPRITEKGIGQVFTFWANAPGDTCFEHIDELPAGHMMEISAKGIKKWQYWGTHFPEKGAFKNATEAEIKEQLYEKLTDAMRLRLRADVPVASYLSGGIDSSIIAAMVKKHHNNNLETFSVAFKDKNFDESPFQQEMVNHIGTKHATVTVSYNDIANDFIDSIWYGEKPLMRTAPAPLFALSRLVRESGIKVVLTGEGADEVFGGYNIFKEDKLRRFWARQPESLWRPRLLAKLYPYIQNNQNSINPFWEGFFKKGLNDTENPTYSHNIRWENTAMIRMLFNKHYKAGFKKGIDMLPKNFLGNGFNNTHPLNRAQQLEINLFMSGYLLSSQGDRMMMGNSVEGRFPFLDHNVIEFAASLNPALKIKSLNEKYILKQTFKDLVPPSIVQRAKQPYRAPISKAFLNKNTPELIKELLNDDKLNSYGYFNPKGVHNLKRKLTQSATPAAKDEMALNAVISTQLLHWHFVDDFNRKEYKLAEKKKVIILN